MATITISKLTTTQSTTQSTKKTKKPNKSISMQNARQNATSPVIDYLQKAERVNGRAAMIGFTSAVLDEYITGNSISTQFMNNIGLSVATIGLVILGTASNPKDEGESRIQAFTRNAETVNGRLAMIGVTSLLLTESLHPQIPLF